MARNSIRTAALALAITSGCGDYRVPLPNGFELIRLSGNEFAIADPPGGRYGQRIVVNATVEQFAVDGALVVGRARIPDSQPGANPPGRTADAYFVLDTATGERWEGDYEAWREKLRERGLSEEARLIRPTRFLVAKRPW